MGEVAAIGSLLGGAAQVGSMLFSNNSAAEQQLQLAQNAQQNALNQQAYQQQLNSVAMRRAIAGVTDALGNRMYYDPSTNEWKTVLSERGQTIQSAADNAAIQRNTTDYQRQLRANEGAERRALGAEGAAQPMLEAIKRFKPTDRRALEGDLQEASSLAHREAYQPVIDSTLRQFARTGSAAGPVLSNLASSAATSLRRAMLDNVIKARMSTTEINNAERGGMIRDFATMNRESTPAFNYSPLSSDSPLSALSSIIAQRSTNAPMSANYAAQGVPGSTNAFNNATGAAIAAVPNSNLLSAQLSGLSNTLAGGKLTNALSVLFNQGAGNTGDSSGEKITYNPNWNTVNSGTWE